MSGQLVEQWPIKTLGELCNIFNGNSIPAKVKKEKYLSEQEGLPYIGTKDVGFDNRITYDTGVIIPPSDYEKFRLAPDKCTFICAEGGSAGRKIGFTEQEVFFGNKLYAIVPHSELVSKFVYYFCQSEYFKEQFFDLMSGMIGGVNQKKFKTIRIPIPPLQEQHRIVSILDEAFAKINNSKGQLEQKLAGAKEIYFSVIHSQEGDKAPLGNFVDIKTGKLNSNAAVEGGQYPFFTCSRKPSEIDHYAFDCEAILLAGNNASGDFNVKHYSGKFNAYQRTYIITISDEQKLTYRYLYHQMVKSLKELKSSSVGTATKFLKLGMIKDLQINVPSLDKQITLQEQIDKLENESGKLEKNYLCELEMLDEFKQSILQEAFNGTL